VSAPSGVVTFLFTDIEGSTRRWESDADAMRSALAAHDEVLRTTIESHGGFLFKHTGDGVIAAFASPRSAVDAAIAAQREVKLPVRMGIATGEATHQDGDYFGAVLNRAARVMAAGHGGQILVADSTASLVSGIDLLDLGPRRLRDLTTPVGLFQVRGPGLREDFPPLRALDTNPGNLRSATTSLIGRESDVAEITDVVRAHRLVTLTGVGGVGKTRLALEAARQMSDESPDGVWLFELAAVTDPAAIPDAVAAVLGITQQPGMTLSQSIAMALEGRVRLLLFDNCEHVLDAAAALIEAILEKSATTRILVTSRESLGIADEQVWRVPSLDTDTAVGLFAERARSVAQEFSPDDTAAISEICDRLDGIPLAVELAASRMASMTAGEVRDRLDHRFRLLVGSRRGLERHQTLRHAVQWSYDLLDDDEKALLETSAIFAGGFTLESVCAVSGSDDDFATLDLLDTLVRKSLLTADHSSGHTRFSMLETIRQFAEEQLVARGDAGKLRSAHAQYFARCEAAVMNIWDGPRQPEAYDWFSTELPNLRGAFRWAADRGDLDAAAAIASYAGWFGVLIENFEPVSWAEELVDRAREDDHPRLAAICAIASLCFLFGRVEDALEYSQVGQSALDRSPARLRFGAEQLWLGAVYSAIPGSDRYVAFYQEQLECGMDALGLGMACVAIALRWSGRTDEALSAASDLVGFAEASPNPFVASFALNSYGMACSAHDPIRALDALKKGVKIAHETGNRANESYIAIAIAMTLNRIEGTSAYDRSSLDYLSLAIRNFHDSGNITQLRASLGILVTYLDRHGRSISAATIAGFAGVVPTAAPNVPEFEAGIAHLREVLSAETYQSLARKGEAMTMATMVSYAYDQIDRVRHELEQLP
jgi:predicted ATPase